MLIARSQVHNITLDANYRWIHEIGTYNNCYTNGQWETDLCPDAETCTEHCALEGATYTDYGISTSGSSVRLNYRTDSSFSTNYGSRVFLMSNANSTYKKFNLKNRELRFQVDASRLECGTNGALYFVEMDADGGSGRFPGNTAGAAYGTGYCDGKCPRDQRFVNGVVRLFTYPFFYFAALII